MGLAESTGKVKERKPHLRSTIQEANQRRYWPRRRAALHTRRGTRPDTKLHAPGRSRMPGFSSVMESLCESTTRMVGTKRPAVSAVVQSYPPVYRTHRTSQAPAQVILTVDCCGLFSGRCSPRGGVVLKGNGALSAHTSIGGRREVSATAPEGNTSTLSKSRPMGFINYESETLLRTEACRAILSHVSIGNDLGHSSIMVAMAGTSSTGL